MYWKAIAVKRESTMEYLNKNSVNDLCVAYRLPQYAQIFRYLLKEKPKLRSQLPGSFKQYFTVYTLCTSFIGVDVARVDT